jgi:hypothetical protein
MRSLDDVFARLATSPFRQRFRLVDRELSYPANDGKQTTFQGHPVFVAQHATACCCRGCLAKWHGIAQGQALTAGDRWPPLRQHAE